MRELREEMEKEAAALAADVRAREAAEAEVAHMKQAAPTCKQEERKLIKGEAEAEPVVAKLAEREREREEVAAKVKQLRLERAKEKELAEQLKQEREATAARELEGLVPQPQSLASATIAPATPPTRVEQAQASTTPPGKPRPGMSWTVDEAADAVERQPDDRDTSSLPADPVADCSQAQVAANQDDGRENRELRLPMVPRLNLNAVEDKIEAAREDALKQAVPLCCAVALHVLLLHFLAHVQTGLQAVSCRCTT
ncbi:MAG: hypothetical protein ACPIOQ_08100, partial [Promethearchaeia archaeon]